MSVTDENQELINTICEALLEKKAERVLLMDVRKLTSLSDYFIVCHGTNDTQVKALASNVLTKVSTDLDIKPFSKEGMDARRWVIIDYVDIVVHVFLEEVREYYSLERMWSDAKVTQIEDSKS